VLSIRIYTSEIMEVNSMIEHVVMFKFEDMAQMQTKDENLQEAKEKLIELSRAVPEIVDYYVGENIASAPFTYDLILMSKFTSRDDLETYINHPLHKEFLGFIQDVVQGVSEVNFQR